MTVDLFSRYRNVTVLGAAGKMGRGIVLLISQRLLLANLGDNQNRELLAVDLSLDGLTKMMKYIEAQALRYAEKKIDRVRQLYVDDKALKEDSDFIEKYKVDLLALIKATDSIDSAYDSELIFEAAAEVIDIKAKLFKTIAQNSSLRPYFFTNTSSIPIAALEKASELEGRIIGFHFYNPPPVQKLLEVIRSESTEQELLTLTDELVQSLNKIAVYAPDCAGFIGNGQFIREISFAFSLTKELSAEYGINQAMYIVNEISKKLLLRPMGIFELIDYVGINVCDFIMGVMKRAFMDEEFHDDILSQLLEAGRVGGQNTQGKTQNGIFEYESGRITSAFDLTMYQAVNSLDFGDLSFPSWKELKTSANREEAIETTFTLLRQSEHPLAKLAIRYGRACHSIGQGLVNRKIAFSEADVNKVMTLGFHHLYGPINPYFN